jgi:toxin ParE1/3/4
MSLSLRRSELFIRDFEIQVDWYFRRAGEEIAVGYLEALDRTLAQLARHPGLGRIRHFRHPKLQGLRSFRVAPPFNRHLIFYRFDASVLVAERVVHGMRNLPRRLIEPPGSQ